MRLCTPVFVACVVVGLTAPVRAQAVAAQPPTIEVYSREIAVDVTVSDAQGRPVHDLTRDDFTVKENGRVQPIRFFREYRGSVPASAPAPQRLPPGVYTNYQATPESGPVQILLLDSLNDPLNERPGSLGLGTSSLALEELHWVQQSIAGYLGRMAPGTQIAVFWLSDSGLHLLQGFTSDRAALWRAVSVPRLDTGEMVERWTRDWVTIDALNQIAEYVSAVHGRKNLLWFTPGMPIRLLRDGGYAWAGSQGGGMGQVHRLMDVFDLFTKEQVAVYPISPAASPHLGTGSLVAEEVAESTGGLAIYNTSDLTTGIAAAIEHGSEYYTLTYSPPGHTDDGHYHRIEVEVVRPGLRLAYRRGYNSETLPERPRLSGPALIKASMEGKAPPATTLLFDAKVVPTEAEASAAKGGGKDKSTSYTIRYLVPQPQVGLALGADESSTGAVEFDAVAYDINGRRVALASQTMEVHLTPEEVADFQARPLEFSQVIALPAGPVTLRIGVLDSTSGKVGTLEVPITAGADR